MENRQKAVDSVIAFAKGKADRQAAIDGANKLLDLSKQLEANFDVLLSDGSSGADSSGKIRVKPALWQHSR